MTMVTTVIITRVMTVIITMVMSMVMFNPNRSQRICLEIVLNFGDSLGIPAGFGVFSWDSHVFGPTNNGGFAG